MATSPSGPQTDAKQETGEQGGLVATQVARELHWLEKLNIFGQMGLVMVGVIAAIIYGRQLQEMRRTNDLTQQALGSSTETLNKTLEKLQGQINAANNLYGEAQRQTLQANRSADEAHRSVDQAKRSAESVQSNFIQDQRPYLWLDDAPGPRRVLVDPTGSGTNTGKLNIKIIFKNYGKSPAMSVRSTGYISIDVENVQDDIDWSEMPRTGVGIYPPGGTFSKNLRSKHPIDSFPVINSLRADPSAPIAYALHALVDYSDQSGGSYQSEICILVQANGVEKRCLRHNIMK